MPKFTAREAALRVKMLTPHPTQYPQRIMYYDARTTREAFESSNIYESHMHRRHGQLKVVAKLKAKLCKDGAWRLFGAEA